MDALDLSRWQFGITTVYHFIFVPITIGLSALVAGLQTAWVRTGKEEYLRATKFWGKLFLINFAIGVVTGIVQEFQFGMNWSAYSRFVGDIFGAPLAIEGLLAFFLESTFLGLWIFGWDRLPRLVHLAAIWMVSIGTMLSAYFILAANSWMQHPVGFTMGDGRAELTSIGAVLTNSTTLVTFPHTITACFLTAGALMLAVSAWHLRRGNQDEVFRPSLRLGAWVVLIAGLGVLITGDIQARVMTEQQPMKMAAAEALYETTESASFSLFTIGSLDGSEELWSVRVPSLLSFMATGDPAGEVEGINDLQAAYEEKYGAGDYVPYVPVTYWSFRLMIGFGALAMLIAAAALWFTRGDRTPRSRWLWIAAVSTVAMPLLANSFGWIFTEMGRQPWTVFGIFKTAQSGSPAVSTGEAATGLIALTVLYGILAVIEVGLFLKYAALGAPDIPPASDETDKPLAFAY
ncbi:cytochrome ubiquinol oxidase subunit I [Actinoplanes lobatus]|uniref:Cytochrome d ubiquinol oxidase subunit I n=1 Tax=Actinoplanes lobatus TaxID=113568 RepID=A0A7W7HIC1_9ACTN|nr:cytochrome ubiquinol oxidase subunit I [Actinoplanes lobatus]MBB4751061.1 cytochrome d ubiquinol oxidase subunit I [Actinoplanes lobatus]GGN92682.1 cytochrome ubiquinol oxidase subunit I [Actinoplanes lobatus]GIE44940.1 cytochrome ubiquinol oxidase subunit I [Actinoplanes lobatus]